MAHLIFNHPINQLTWIWGHSLDNYCDYSYKNNNIVIKVDNYSIQIPFDLLMSLWDQLILFGDITIPMKKQFNNIIKSVKENRGVLVFFFTNGKTSRINLKNIIRHINLYYKKQILNPRTLYFYKKELN